MDSKIQQRAKLLDLAFTHSSYANENGVESNERLELLGDAVISLACIDYLYKKYPNSDEGVLTQLKTNLVNGKQLAKIGEFLKLDKQVKLGNGETLSSKTLGRAVEAVIGACYLEEGYELTRLRLTGIFDRIETGEIPVVSYNYKGELQRFAQEAYKVDPKYYCISTFGPDHSKTYLVEVHVKGIRVGTGDGTSIKDAEQSAAQNALIVQRQFK